VKLKFLGTRGEIDIKSRLHRMHSSLEISYRGHRVVIDCGADWLRRVHHILGSHGNPFHQVTRVGGTACLKLLFRSRFGESVGEEAADGLAGIKRQRFARDRFDLR